MEIKMTDFNNRVQVTYLSPVEKMKLEGDHTYCKRQETVIKGTSNKENQSSSSVFLSTSTNKSFKRSSSVLPSTSKRIKGSSEILPSTSEMIDEQIIGSSVFQSTAKASNKQCKGPCSKTPLPETLSKQSEGSSSVLLPLEKNKGSISVLSSTLETSRKQNVGSSVIVPSLLETSKEQSKGLSLVVPSLSETSEKKSKGSSSVIPSTLETSKKQSKGSSLIVQSVSKTSNKQSEEVSSVLQSTSKNCVNLFDQPSEEHVSKIIMLNDDCLAYIFSFLSQRELIKIERVCKWWQEVSLVCWRTMKQVSTLDILQETSPTDEVLKCIFKRCGKYVKFLTVDLHFSYFQIIFHHCSVLQSLDIINLDFTHGISFYWRLEELQELKLTKCNASDDGLKMFFQICPNIRSLYISECDFIKGMVLESPILHKSLEKLAIIKCFNIRLQDVIAGLKRMEKLKSLTFRDSVNQVKKTHFIEIVSSVPNVDHLSFSNCLSPDESPRSTLTGISKDLISLDVCDNWLMSDDVMEHVAETCVKLESLNISGCICMTDIGVRSVSKLRHLKFLSIGNIRNDRLEDYVSDLELGMIALRRQLVKLEVHLNQKITDKGCSKILSLCEELEHLDVSGCSNITDATIFLAEAVVNSRTNRKKITLVVGGTSVSGSRLWKDFSPLLIVDFRNYSRYWQRDGDDYVSDFDSTEGVSDDDSEGSANSDDSDDHTDGSEYDSGSNSDDSINRRDKKMDVQTTERRTDSYERVSDDDSEGSAHSDDSDDHSDGSEYDSGSDSDDSINRRDKKMDIQTTEGRTDSDGETSDHDSKGSDNSDNSEVLDHSVDSQYDSGSDSDDSINRRDKKTDIQTTEEHTVHQNLLCCIP